MNAIQQPSRPHLQTAENRRTVTPKRQRERRYTYGAVAVETVAKLTINVLMLAAAIAALGQLIPYYTSEQAKLIEIHKEVKGAEKRVDRLQEQFNHNFDPHQARSVMQEQSHRVDPTQRQVIMLDNARDEEPAP